MRFHVPGIPGRPLTREHSQCAYTQKVRKFGEMMAPRGHEVFLYGPSEHDEMEGVEYVECYPDAEPMDYDLSLWGPFNQSALIQIRKKMEARDFLCLVGGRSQMNITEDSLLTCEPFVGYEGVFTQYRAFESYAWMHTVYGLMKGAHDANGEFYDAVIPNYFDVNDQDFPYVAEKDDYLLYIGRMIDRKGVQVAVDTAKSLGARLLLAGGDGDFTPTYGEHVGMVGPAERAALMSHAKAIMVPTIYIEPFGAVVSEAAMCGTPAITTDWGAFTETVEQGVTGYRCRTLAEFCWAAEAVERLDPQLIRERALARWSYDAIAPQFETWFERLQTLYEDGWYSEVGVMGESRN